MSEDEPIREDEDRDEDEGEEHSPWAKTSSGDADHITTEDPEAD